MMYVKHLLCTMLLTVSVATTAFGANNTTQTINAFSENNSEEAIELTGSKVITDDFSFKMPDSWKGNCILIQYEDSLEVYDKISYEEDASGLLFAISVYDDSEYLDLSDYTVLGFCGNRTYVFEDHFSDLIEDMSSSEYKACKEAGKTVRKSFVAFIKDTQEETVDSEIVY